MNDIDCVFTLYMYFPKYSSCKYSVPLCVYPVQCVCIISNLTGIFQRSTCTQRITSCGCPATSHFASRCFNPSNDCYTFGLQRAFKRCCVACAPFCRSSMQVALTERCTSSNFRINEVEASFGGYILFGGTYINGNGNANISLAFKISSANML